MEIDPLDDGTQCGEIFISKNLTFRLNCILCEKYFDNFLNFQNHCLNFDCSLVFNNDDDNHLDVSVVTSITSITNLPERRVDNDDIWNNSGGNKVSPIATKQNNVTNTVNLNKNYDHESASFLISSVSSKILPEIRIGNDIWLNCAGGSKVPSLVLATTNVENFSTNNDYESTPIYDSSNKNLPSTSQILKVPEASKPLIYLCKICNKEFSASLKLSNHVQSDHMKRGLLPCPHCEKVFRNYSNIKRHISLHLGEKPHCCELCDKRYAKKSLLNLHIDSIHKKLKDHECKICAKCFSNKPLLDKHQVVHTGETPFKCKICNLAYKTGYGLFVHKRNHHPELLPFQCEKCLKRYSNKPALKRHECQALVFDNTKYKEATEGILNKRLSCIGKRKNKGETIQGCVKIVNSIEIPIYKRDRKNQQQQQIHETNNSSMSYVCEFCGKRFQFSPQYKIHCRIHTGEKPYKCPQIDCNRKFATKSSLNNHYTIHSGEKNYKCTYCEKRFRLISRLRIHIRSHTGERPFSCEVCEKAFHSRANLVEHLKNVHQLLKKKTPS